MKMSDLIAYPAPLAIFVIAIWGFNVVAMKIAVADISPMLFNGLRFLILSILLLPFCRITLRQLRQLAPIAVVMGLGHFYTLNLSLLYVESIVTSVILLLGAPCSALLAWLYLGERLSRMQVGSIIIATLGAIGPSLWLGTMAMKWGILLAAFCILMWAVGNLQVRRLEKLPLLTLQFWIACITAPICFLAYQLSPEASPIWPQLSRQLLIILAYLVLASSLLAYGIWYSLIHQHGISKIAIFILLQPAFTMLAGHWLLDENQALSQWLGGLITISAIFIYYRQDKCTVNRTRVESDHV